MGHIDVWPGPIGFRRRERTGKPPRRSAKPEAATAIDHGPTPQCLWLPSIGEFEGMAFVSRIGNALRRTSVSTSSPLLQLVRCMSSSKLFVGGLSYATDETTLKNAFSAYGNVLEARIITDRESGRSKGFGFITYTSTEEASAAMTSMDGKELQGRSIRVDHANDRAGGIRGGGGFGSGGGGGYPTGGYGGGGGGGYSSGGYAGNGGYGVGSGSGYVGNYNNASGGGYSGNYGYGDGADSGGYANNSSSGRYNTTGSSDGNTGGYNSSPNTYGAGNYGAANYNTGSSSGGTSGEFGGDFSGGRFGGNNFAGNVTGGGGYSGSSSTGEFYGGGASYGANKPQYNGQDDLMGDFFDKEVAEGK